MRLGLSLLVGGVFLTACATAAPPQPDLPAPPAFKGEAGWDAVKGETKIVTLSPEKGEVFMRQKVIFKRTGVLENDVINKTWLGDNVVLKAGSPMYASSYRSGYNTYNSGLSYGIAWCSPGDADISSLTNFLIGGRQTTCLTWNRKSGAIGVASGAASDSAFYSNSLTIMPVNEVNFPDITESGVSLDSDFYFTGEISGINPGKNIRFRERFEDRSGKTTMRTTKYELNENGEAIVPVWGGKIAVKPISETSVTIVELEPVKDHIMTGEERLEKLRELMLQFQQEKAEKPITDEPQVENGI